MKRYSKKLLATLVICVLLGSAGLYYTPKIVSSHNGEHPVFETSVKEEVEEVILERVVDGDTVVVVLPSGAQEYVRLIGIDAPESVHDDPDRNTEEGLVTSDYLKSLLKEGQTLYLTKDISDRDRYERLLRYVWFTSPSETTDFSQDCLNAKLVADGFAQAKQYPPDTKYARELEELGNIAIQQELGVSAAWA